MKYFINALLVSLSYGDLIIGTTFKADYACMDLIDEWIYGEQNVGTVLYEGRDSWGQLKTKCRSAYMDVDGGLKCV